jgi:large subunit ribosomal protein L25
MTELLVLQAELRKEKGSRQMARLRDPKVGKLPAVVYGHGEEPIHISLNAHDFLEGLHHGHRIFEIQLPTGKQTLLVKDLQYDHFGRTLVHADLMRVDLNERMVVSVPIELKGTAKGTHEGGIVDQSLTNLEVECVVSRIPKVIPVSVKELGVGDAIHARDVELPAGSVLKTDPEAILCICHLPKIKAAVEEAAATEAPTEPEVITERAAPEEEQAEAPEKEKK